MSYADPITQLQEDIAALLGEDARLAEVSIEQEQKGTVQQLIATALRGIAATAPKKAGLVVIVDMPEFKVGEPDSPIIEFIVEPTITIFERPLFNRTAAGTGITAALAVEYVASRLHYRTTGLGTLLCQKADPLQTDDGLVSGYTVVFNVRRGLQPETRSSVPIIAIAGGSCTLTGGALPGEVIYYTTNGNAPVPGGAGVQIYAAPFAVSAGDFVRASSKATGRVLSDFSMEEAA